MINWFLVVSILLIFLADACLKTQSSDAAIVCGCESSDVALTTDGTTTSYAPTGNITGVDSNDCPLNYTITCNSTTATLQFQDGVSGGTTGTVVLDCTDGNWLYTTDSGTSLIVSASCLSA